MFRKSPQKQFPKQFRRIFKKFTKFFQKLRRNKFSKSVRFSCLEKNILFCMILNDNFQKIKSPNIDQSQIGYDYFCLEFEGL